MKYAALVAALALATAVAVVAAAADDAAPFEAPEPTVAPAFLERFDEATWRERWVPSRQGKVCGAVLARAGRGADGRGRGWFSVL